MLRRCFSPALFFFRSLRRLLCMLQATHAHTRRLVLISLLLRRTTSTSTTMATSPANGGTVAAPAAAAATPAPAAAAPTETTPLGAVVKDAVRRWYEDALREAERGDVVSKARRRERERERGDGCAPSSCCPQPHPFQFPFPLPFPFGHTHTETTGAPIANADRRVRLHAGPGGRRAVGCAGSAAWL